MLFLKKIKIVFSSLVLFSFLLAVFSLPKILPQKLFTKNESVNQVFAQKESDPQIFNLKVLYVTLNPVEGDKDLATEFFRMYWEGRNVSQQESYIADSIINAFKRLSNNTIVYQVAKKVNISKFPLYTNGFEYTFEKYRNCVNGDPGGICEQQKFLFDTNDWITKNQICELANENNIDEIWLLAPPFITTYETFMIGPNPGFNINGPYFTILSCSKHYAVISLAYNRSDTILHPYGHKIESNMTYLTQNWQQADYQKYWESFVIASSLRPYCGNCHFPPNAINVYNYDNLNFAISTCPDWKNFPELQGTTENINCNVWGCNDNGWQEYWFGNLPRSNGEAILTDKTGNKFLFKKNWWYYLLYPDNSINFVKNPPRPTPTQIPTSPPIVGDFNNDGKVNEADLDFLLSKWGSSQADLNQDGKTDEKDLTILLANWKPLI